MRSRSFLSSAAGLLLLTSATIAPVLADDWQPVAPEDLAMTAEPRAPGAAAIYLYRQVDRDDNEPGEVVYERIKVLSEAGRKYADLEIPFEKSKESVREIRARTIRPDGTIAKFDGTIFEKAIVKGRGIKYLAKTLALPDVQVGSIIEYRYRHSFEPNFVFNSHWILSQELYTRLARFSLQAYSGFGLTWSWPVGFPAGTEPPREKNGKIRLETRDVPAFVVEDDMPPEDALKTRVEFIYSDDEDPVKDPDAYWKRFGKKHFHVVDDFADEPRVMVQALAQIVQPGDADEVKLRKIYERCQQIRNVTFDRQVTAEESKRENLKAAHDVGDVWQRGHGDAFQVTWLFMALARAAGLQADPVLVSTRDQYFFDRRTMNPWQLNSNVVVVKLAGKDLFLDPGTVYTPFGMLPWHETAVVGLRLDKQGGGWLSTPAPVPTDSRIERRAVLKMTDSGALAGKLTVTYSGLEAHWRRLEERDDDARARREYLEEEVKSFVPTGINVKLTNAPDWSSSAPTLVAEFDLEVPGWADMAGRRALLAVGLFGNEEKYQFTHAAREHPLYFSFPYQHLDDITIELPADWQVSSVPTAKSNDQTVLVYSVATDSNGQTLHVKRSITLNLVVLAVKYYDSVREFFQAVRAGDEEQIVVSRSATPTKS